MSNSPQAFAVRCFAITAGVILFPLAGCGDGPVEPSHDPPFLDSFELSSYIDHDLTGPRGVVWIRGRAGDPEFRTSEAARFPVELRTSSGDFEIASLRRGLCGPNANASYWVCDQVSVLMVEGHAVTALYPLAEEIGARLFVPQVRNEDGSVVFVSMSYGTLQLFGMPLDATVRRVKRWPGVRDAGYSYVAFLGAGDPPDAVASRGLHAALPLDLSSPVVQNGRLEARESDTITVTYTQPDGAVLIHERVLRLR